VWWRHRDFGRDIAYRRHPGLVECGAVVICLDAASRIGDVDAATESTGERYARRRVTTICGGQQHAVDPRSDASACADNADDTADAGERVTSGAVPGNRDLGRAHERADAASGSRNAGFIQRRRRHQCADAGSGA